METLFLFVIFQFDSTILQKKYNLLEQFTYYTTNLVSLLLFYLLEYLHSHVHKLENCDDVHYYKSCTFRINEFRSKEGTTYIKNRIHRFVCVCVSKITCEAEKTIENELIINN